MQQKIALVTGASSGIGKALVIELLAQGYTVIGISSSQEKLAKLQSEVQNTHLSLYACDVSKIEEVRKISEELIHAHTIPNLFFLNAGIAGQPAIEPMDSIDLEVHQKIFSVNYFGVLNFAEQWLQPCIEHGGATFVVSNSINAIFAPPGGCAYSASKVAIAKAFDALRLTYINKNLKFLNIYCGPVDTAGLAGKFPLTWSPDKMATYMIKKAEKGAAQSHPSWGYTTLAKILNWLPSKWTLKILGI